MGKSYNLEWAEAARLMHGEYYNREGAVVARIVHGEIL